MKENTIVENNVSLSMEYALSIELTLRAIFACDRGGFGGEIEAEIIRVHPFLSMMLGLAYVYASKPEKKDEIDNFISDFCRYRDFSIDDILKMTSKENRIDEFTVFILEKCNGCEQLNYMISKFDEICGF